MPSGPSDKSLQSRRNGRLAIICGVVFVAMVGAAYAAVPFYRAFCQATGLGGTTQRATKPSSVVIDKTITVRFDTNVRNLPWTFTAEQLSQDIKLGATGMAYFKVTNKSDHPITGRAVYNVVPEQAGIYFHKIHCFCFSDQTIAAGKTVEFPMIYFVDPGYATDRDTKDQAEVTLSYTYYPAADAPKTQALATQALGGPRSAAL